MTPQPQPGEKASDDGRRYVTTYCYNCVAGPDLLRVEVRDGVATGISPNHAGAGIHPAEGRPCVKAYGLIQKTYSPYRVLTPMKRTNPRKGMDEDPGFVPISWDEALDLIAAKLKGIRERGLEDEAGYPRLAVSLGHGGTPAYYMGTFPAFLSAWGLVDYSFGSGQGVKCVHSEHLYGEYWHRAFTVSADTPLVKLNLSFGANVEVTGGPSAVMRQANARVRGARRIVIEPHLSVTGAVSAEWVPIKPKTDPAFMFALIHVMLHERARGDLDLEFLRDRTASPYLVGPNGFYLRDPDSGEPLVFDSAEQRAVPHDHPGVVPALSGTFAVGPTFELGADGERWTHDEASGTTAFDKLVAHIAPYSPEWAGPICEVDPGVIRRIAHEFVDTASVGETIEIDGRILPYRPVAVTLGKTVNNGWGAFECCWARTMLAVLVGALEVPGGTLGTTVRINRPHEDRMKSVRPGVDGFLHNDLNPTDAEHWIGKPGRRNGRNAHRTLVPLAGNGPWSQALGPTHLAWMFTKEAPEHWPQPQYPDVWITFRTNPAISFWDTHNLVKTIAGFPFMVSFAYTVDETNWMADVLLPEATDLESTQLIRLGRTKFVEQYWEHEGFVLRQPAVEPMGEARDFTWITNQLAQRTGLLERYNESINRGAGGVPLRGEHFDFSLDPATLHDVDAIWDAECKAATSAMSNGEEVHDLAWFRKNGFYTRPYSQRGWYLYPAMVEQGLRFELPYQERLMRSGLELMNRLHEAGMHWWDEQLAEYQFLPAWDDVPKRWENAIVHAGRDPAEFPFWLLTTKSMQFHASGNVSIPQMHEVAQNVRGHHGIVINRETARSLGIGDGDELEVASLVNVTRGPAILAAGIRPDTLLMIGQFDHWATPYAKELHAPSLNTVAAMSLELTDATGSGSDIVRVSIRRVGATADSGSGNVKGRDRPATTGKQTAPAARQTTAAADGRTVDQDEQEESVALRTGGLAQRIGAWLRPSRA